MSTLEKAIGLLQKMPERKLEAAYMYIRFVNSQSDSDIFIPAEENIASNTEKAKRLKGFQGLMAFAGTLPEDFDYKQELEDAREEKYARFI
ncbi:MAG TPA: hypothetical protein DD414_01735 [Lachnospiraceae bacterium]|nr:hypothetical protein [Lachnospiraceae bacterium]